MSDETVRQSNIYRCKRCAQWSAGKSGWISADFESKELMGIALKRIKTNREIKIVDAAWIWTEEHSQRLKLKITLQKEIVRGAVMQQSCIVELIIRGQQCPDCNAQFNNRSWKAQVQVRQRVNHKRTFFYLEQVILKKRAQENAVKIEQFRDGLDFFFKEKNEAIRFVGFVEDACPCKTKNSKKLVSADLSSNLFHHQYTAILEIAPACKDDILLLSKNEARRLGDLPQVCLVKSVNSSIKLVDPRFGHLAELDSITYFRNPPDILLTAKHLIDFVVLDVDISTAHLTKTSHKQVSTTYPTKKEKKRRRQSAPESSNIPSIQAARREHHVHRGLVADVVLAREKDLGVNDDQYFCTTHLGALLRAGDIVKGYDMRTANLPADLAAQTDLMPDVVLVRKARTKSQARPFQLKRLDDEIEHDDQESQTEDHDIFMDQLESDRDMRSNVNLYKNPHTLVEALHISSGDDDDEQIPEDPDALQLEELLDDLKLGSGKEEERDVLPDNEKDGDLFLSFLPTAPPQSQLSNNNNINTAPPPPPPQIEDDL